MATRCDVATKQRLKPSHGWPSGRMTNFEGASALKLSSWYVGNAEAQPKKSRQDHEGAAPCVNALQAGAFGFCDAARLGRKRGGLGLRGGSQRKRAPDTRSHEQENTCSQDGPVLAPARVAERPETDQHGSERKASLTLIRFGFTLIYNREVALKHPFQDKNLGEDYDWCMELMDSRLHFLCLQSLRASPVGLF